MEVDYEAKQTVELHLPTGSATATAVGQELDALPMASLVPERVGHTGEAVIKSASLLYNGANHLVPADLAINFGADSSLMAPISVLDRMEQPTQDAPLADGQEASDDVGGGAGSSAVLPAGAMEEHSL